jgi:hypothetical protein
VVSSWLIQSYAKSWPMICCGDVKYNVDVFIIWEEKKSTRFGNCPRCNHILNVLNFALTMCK